MEMISTTGLTGTVRPSGAGTPLETAKGVLHAWGLAEATLIPLSEGMHATFRVDSPNSERFALKLYGERTHGPEEVRSEMLWLASLRRDAGLLVPEPVAAADGELVVRAGGERLAVLTRWVNGEMLGGALDAPTCRRFGDFMARLHRHAERFAMPPGFARPRYDLERLLGAGTVIPAGTGDDLYTARDREILDAAAALVRRELEPLGEGRDAFGLVHGDLQVTNYVFWQGQVGAIDFADFGWGHYLYDASTLLLPLWERRDFSELSDAFLRGYRQARPLPDAQWAALETFLVARALYLLRWTAENQDRPAVRESAAGLVPHIKGQIARFLERREPARGQAVAAGTWRSVVQLLTDLRERGIRLWEEGGQLSFKAPKGALTPELRAELGERKAEVLSFLRQKAAPAQVGLPLVPVPRDGEIPLSFGQQRLWVLDRLEPGSPVYNIAQAVRLRGRLDAGVLGRALGEVVRRHEALRTTFGTVDGRPVQIIATATDAALRVIDLRHLPDGERNAEARRLADEETLRPFNLEQGPPARFTLLRVGAAEALLVLNVHHIVSDGWSSGILVRELLALYDAFAHGRPSPLPELPLQYADFAVWQRRWLQGDVLEAQVTWWREQLAGAPGLLDLPTDRPRPRVQTYRGAREMVVVPLAVADALEALGRRIEATPFMVLLAAFQLLLHGFSGSDDVPVGSPIANRNRGEIEGLIGLFINTLVLRGRFTGGLTFQGLLEQSRQATLGAYAHQDLPFETLVDVLRPERSASHTPLFQSMFILQNAPVPALEIPGLVLSYEDTRKATAKFDLMLSLWQTADGLRGSLTYNTDLFDRSTAVRLIGRFGRLLQAVAAEPGVRLSELTLLEEAERHQLFLEWNDTDVTMGGEGCLHELFAEQVRRTPAAPALVFGGEEWTYRDLDRRAARLARRLRALGVGPEIPVGVCARRSPDLVASLLGVLKAGGAYVPLDPNYPPDRLALMLDDSRAPVLVTQRELLGLLPPHDTEVVLLDDLADDEEEGVVAPSGAGLGNLAYFIYTSGSTGRPKGVAIEHRSASVMVRWARTAFSDAECAGVLASTSVCFDLSVFELFVPLTRGGCVILAENALALPRLAAAGRVTLINTVPSAMTELAHLGGVPPSVRTVNLAGEPLPGRLVADLYALGTVEAVWNLYGPSEDTTYSTFIRVERGDSLPPAIGRPLDRTRVRLLDVSQRPVPLGVHGEVCLGGSGLARGYFGRPELTAERFIPDPFAATPGERLYRTGDLARFLPDGRLDYLGRTDHQVKVRGFRIELGEVESVLGRHPGVREAAVVADAQGGGRLVAFFVPADGHEAGDQALRKFLGASLPAYMIPAAFVKLDRLPLTPNGKVDRRSLTASGGVRLQTETVFVAPRTPVERQLAEIWSELLELERVGVHDSFFDAGGNSLLATRLLARLRQAFAVDLPLAAFFEAPTVADLAESIEVARRVLESQTRERATGAQDREEGEL
jgi:amino acid adenylation domain-containing protein